MRKPVWVVALAFIAAAVGFFLGDSYIGRMPHHQGYFLVPVPDVVTAPLSSRPRRAVVIVVDGLRRDAAETMKSAQRIAERGQCRVADQGDFTVSRPVYAMLSTGLEADRTGSRNNDLTSPLAAQSIWQVARAQGMRVVGSSHLPWFQELFPDGFDRFRHAEPLEDDVFGGGPDGALLDADLVLVHPLYVDETAHLHRADSPAYAAAVKRVDGEMGRLLDQLDFDKDLVLLTSDHGHRDAGGHGGSQPEIRQVLDCFAGPHVMPSAGREPFDGRVTAPLLAVLLGLPFPRDMRAGDDGLDAIWSVARFGPEDAAYVADRRHAVERFRAENEQAVAHWLGSKESASWSALYAQEAQIQWIRIGALALLLVAAMAIGLRRTFRESPLLAAATAGWVVMTALSTWVAHRVILGEFSFTVINRRNAFVPAALLAVAVSGLASVLVHAVLVRRAPSRTRERRYVEQLTSDLLLLVVLLVIVNLGHIVAYGWPLGFPLPPSTARYLPFFSSIVQVVYGLGTAALASSAVAWSLYRRWSERRSRDRRSA